MNSRIAVCAGLLLLIAIGGCTTKPAADRVSACEQLRDLKLPHTEITKVRPTSAGYEMSWGTVLVGLPWFKLPASCRIEGVIRPTPQSEIGFEVWLPQDEWNSRYQGVGSGGLGGSINTLQLRLALQAGYATAATDTGHVAKDNDGAWALNQPEKLRDYGYRAIHETAVNAKAIIAAYYGQGPKFSYFNGASNGGRQGLKEAQLFPEDYDGIISGCPPTDGAAIIAGTAWIQQQLDRAPDAHIPKKKLPAIAAATVKACDTIDGIADGVIDDPRLCNFNPEVLLCKGTDENDCLTAPQLQSLHAIYSSDGGRFGDSIHHGYEPGGELAQFGGWADYITGSAPQKAGLYKLAMSFSRYLIYSDPSWTLQNVDPARFHADTERALGEVYSANDPDMSQFKAHGGKLIVYHGWSDPAIPPRATIDYYGRVRATMGAEATDQFMRLYMVPGLQHGIGGPGTNIFGQVLTTGNRDPQRSVSAALEAWVERGEAPQAIIASRYDSAMKPLIAPDPAKLVRTRPLCPYPQVARWSGKGSTDVAENFRCVAP